MIYLQGKIIDFLDMKKGVAGKFILYLLFNCLGVISLNTTAQEMIKPIRGNILLSGNFGELRATHFHSGIDIRTGGVEGLPVICVKDGMLVRVSVSPTGYGQALYIEHPDGTTTVYGHLQRFAPQISALVRQLQYQQESFKIDENLREYRLAFRQGDTIAFSGNTGSSGGPHLHFEIRNTRTEHTLNPLHYYTIHDNKPPVVKALYLYSIADNGMVELLRRCPVKLIAHGKYLAGRITVPEGRIGVAVYAIDYMNDSWNKLGVYWMSLTAGRDTLFQFCIDSCSFGQSGYINEVKDFDRYKQKETVYRCFGNYQEQFLSIRNRNKGCIEIAKDSLREVVIDLSDMNGNRSTVSLELKGGKAESARIDNDHILRYDRPHTLELPGYRVEIPEGALFHSVEKVLKLEKDTLTGRDIFVLSKKDIPLFKKASLAIQGEYDDGFLICEIGDDGRLSPVTTSLNNDGLTAEIGYLNRYTVAEDREAPTIEFLGKFPGQLLKFRVKDNLAGIGGYWVGVNGEWCLAAYDPRVNLLQCSLSEPGFKRGQVNEVCVRVEDKVGNKNELVVKVR